MRAAVIACGLFWAPTPLAFISPSVFSRSVQVGQVLRVLHMKFRFKTVSARVEGDVVTPSTIFLLPVCHGPHLLPARAQPRIKHSSDLAASSPREKRFMHATNNKNAAEKFCTPAPGRLGCAP